MKEGKHELFLRYLMWIEMCRAIALRIWSLEPGFTPRKKENEVFGRPEKRPTNQKVA